MYAQKSIVPRRTELTSPDHALLSQSVQCSSNTPARRGHQHPSETIIFFPLCVWPRPIKRVATAQLCGRAYSTVAQTAQGLWFYTTCGTSRTSETPVYFPGKGCCKCCYGNACMQGRGKMEQERGHDAEAAEEEKGKYWLFYKCFCYPKLYNPSEAHFKLEEELVINDFQILLLWSCFLSRMLMFSNPHYEILFFILSFY